MGYRGIDQVGKPSPSGRDEYCGIVEEVGFEKVAHCPARPVRHRVVLRLRQHLPHSAWAGYQSSCVRRQFVGAGGAQAEHLRVPLADGTLVATPEMPDGR